MKIFVKAKPSAKENKVIPPALTLIPNADAEQVYTVHTKEPPREGRANEGIIRLLAEHFKVAKSSVRLVSGALSKRKIFEIIDE